MKQAIVQKDEYGCGAACFAFIASVSYCDAVELLGCANAKARGFYCKDLAGALSGMQLPYAYKHLKAKVSHDFPEDAIVFIRRSSRYPAGHWLVRYKYRWMDPWINFEENHNINEARAGFRHQLPGEPQWMCYPE